MLDNLITYLLYSITLLLIYVIARRSKNNNYLFVLLILIPSLIVGLRGVDVGTDTRGYKEILDDVWNYGFSYNTHIEFGFKVIIYSLYFISRSYHFVFFIIAFFTFFGFYYPLKKILVDNNTFSIGVTLLSCLVFFQCMSGIRQCLAASLVCLSFYYLNRKKYLVTILLAIISITIHTSAIIFLLLVPIKIITELKKNKLIATVVLVIAVVLMLFMGQELLDSRYSHLVMNEESETIGLFYILLIIVSTFIFIFSYLKLKKEKQLFNEFFNDDNILVYMVLGLIYPFSQILSLYFHSLSRISWYFAGFEVILLLTIFTYKKYKIFYLALIWIICLYNFYSLMFNNGYHQVPYVFIS